MILTNDILLLAHCLVTFDECCKFIFLLRHVSSVHITCNFKCVNSWQFSFLLFHYCKHVLLTCVLIKAYWWSWWWRCEFVGRHHREVEFCQVVESIRHTVSLKRSSGASIDRPQQNKLPCEWFSAVTPFSLRRRRSAGGGAAASLSSQLSQLTAI